MPVIGERNGRRPLIEEAKLLQKRVRNRQRQLQKLVEEHQQLQLQYELLTSIGAALAEIRDDAGFDVDMFDLASEEVLLQQLPIPGALANSRSETSSMSEDSMQKPFWQQEQRQLTETIASQDKPLQLFTSLKAQPPFPVTETFPTAQDLRNEYASTIRDVSLSLQQHTAGSAAVEFLQAAHPPLEKIKAVMFRFLNLLYTLSMPCALPNSEAVAFQLYTVNCDTGQPLSESNPQHYAWAVGRLGLTRQQQINIATGFAVFKRLIASVLNELRQAGASAGAGAGAGATHPAPSPKKGSRLAASNAQQQKLQQEQQQQQEQEQQQGQEPIDMAEPFAHRAFLDLQQKRLERLQRLQRKEMLLRVLASTYLWGCMSWDQVAKLHVLMFPIAPIPGMVAAAVAQLEQYQD